MTFTINNPYKKGTTITPTSGTPTSTTNTATSTTTPAVAAAAAATGSTINNDDDSSDDGGGKIAALAVVTPSKKKKAKTHHHEEEEEKEVEEEEDDNQVFHFKIKCLYMNGTQHHLVMIKRETDEIERVVFQGHWDLAHLGPIRMSQEEMTALNAGVAAIATNSNINYGMLCEEVVQVSTVFYPVKETFLPALQHMGIVSLMTACDMVGGPNAEAKDVGNLFCCVKPWVRGSNNTQGPSNLNRKGQQSHQPAFWWNHVIHRAQGDKKLQILELAAKIPLCTVENQAAHQDALKSLAHNGPVTHSGFIKLTLFDGYCVSMVNMLQSPILTMATEAGWTPLFLIRNVLQQKSPDFGLNGWRLASCNIHQRSFVAFVGFYKQFSADANDSVLIGITYDGAPLTSTSLQFLNLTGDDR
jgi:hypothetical protein